MLCGTSYIYPYGFAVVPELPEVETIRRELTSKILGRHLENVRVFDPRLVQVDPPKAFETRLIGTCITSITRRGKYLLINVESDTLILHLMMSGRLHLRPRTDIQPHTRLLVTFDYDPALHFVDIRRFGRAWITNEAQVHHVVGHLGPEPLDAGFDWRSLEAGIHGRRVAIKTALLDQRVVAGIGNIYADEALFAARIHPETPVNLISRPKLQALTGSIVSVLESGITHQGTTFSTFETSEGKPGNNQQHLKVFRKTGQPCSVCSKNIRRSVLAQRSTHYCSNCQRKPPGLASK
jgi:formamidopyrimidine-DNA glycosylase